MQILNSVSRRKGNSIRINLLPMPIPIPKSTKTLLSLFSSLIKSKNPRKSDLFEYLTETFNLSEQRAQSVSVKRNHLKSLDKAQSVVQFLQKLGFSETHIRSSVRRRPEILFSDVDRTLKPKIEFLQQLGLVGAHLGKFLSNHSTVLTVSLEKKLIPNFKILMKIFVDDKKKLIRVISKNSWILCIPKGRLLSNIEYLKSYGIVGSQLLILLKKQPRLFSFQESKISELVSRTLDMGFSVDSRMFVHGLYTVGFYREETIEKKLQLLRSFGFSKDECMYMFRRTPLLLHQSEEKLKLGLELLLNKMMNKKEVLLRAPVCLMYSIEDRVIPRYKVLQILKSKSLLKKEPSACTLLGLAERKFLEKFVTRFRNDAEELLVAYKGRKSDSSLASLEEKDMEDK